MIKKIKSIWFAYQIFGSPILPGYYRINTIYWKIHDQLFPKQKWLTDKIGKTWKDKPELITDILFECVINFVEDEKGIVYKWVHDNEFISYNYEKDRLEIEKIYRYAKTIRKRLEEKQWGTSDYKFFKMYENLYNKYETEYCKRIIELRYKLWT